MLDWKYGGISHSNCIHTKSHREPWCYVADGQKCGAIRTHRTGAYWDTCNFDPKMLEQMDWSSLSVNMADHLLPFGNDELEEHEMEHVGSLHGGDHTSQVQVDAEGEVVQEDAAALGRQKRNVLFQHDVSMQSEQALASKRLVALEEEERDATLHALHAEEQMVHLQMMEAVQALKEKERAAVLEGQSHLDALQTRERVLALQAKEQVELSKGIANSLVSKV